MSAECYFSVVSWPLENVLFQGVLILLFYLSAQIILGNCCISSQHVVLHFCFIPLLHSFTLFIWCPTDTHCTVAIAAHAFISLPLTDQGQQQPDPSWICGCSDAEFSCANCKEAFNYEGMHAHSYLQTCQVKLARENWEKKKKKKKEMSSLLVKNIKALISPTLPLLYWYSSGKLHFVILWSGSSILQSY